MEYAALCALLVIGFLVATINESIGKMGKQLERISESLTELKKSEKQ